MSDLKYVMVDKRYWDFLNIVIDIYDNIIGDMPVGLEDMMDDAEREDYKAATDLMNAIEGEPFWEVDLGE